MTNHSDVFSEEEQAFLRLTEDEEKTYFKEILRYEKENDGIVSGKYPKLSINYYIYKYKNEGASFEGYLGDTKDNLILLKNEIDQIGAKGYKRGYGFKNVNKYIDSETDKERRLGRKRNTRFAILILVIVFIFIIFTFLK